jgi:hypothetical protein
MRFISTKQSDEVRDYAVSQADNPCQLRKDCTDRKALITSRFQVGTGVATSAADTNALNLGGDPLACPPGEGVDDPTRQLARAFSGSHSTPPAFFPAGGVFFQPHEVAPGPAVALPCR